MKNETTAQCDCAKEYNVTKLNIMKIERKKRPTRLECALYSKDYYDRCVENVTKNKRFLEEHPSLNDNSVSMIKELIDLDDNAIKTCEQIFKSSHRTRREEFKKLKRSRKQYTI